MLVICSTNKCSCHDE